MVEWEERRTFTRKEVADKIEEQGGVCARCGKRLSLANAQGHHCFPHSKGGPTQSWNMEALDEECHTKETENEKGDEFAKKGMYGYGDEKRGNDLVRDFLKKKPRFRI